MAPIDDLKAKLKQMKGVIGRYLATLSRLVAEKQVAKVNDYLGKTSEAFDAFDGLFTDFVVEFGDNDDTYNDVWFDEVQQRYLAAYKVAADFLAQGSAFCNSAADRKPDLAPVVTEPNARDSDLASDFQAAVNMPRIEIEPFGGDPLKYHSFIRTFNVLVESTCSDPDARLARLVKCTTGPAHDAIQGTLVVGGTAGYARSKKTLAELFGADQIVVQ